jgi:1-acyl-sn-glycerol-3-phosphate acyltransferase
MKTILTINPRSLTMFFYTIVLAVLGFASAVIFPTGRLFTWVAGHLWAPQILWMSGLDARISGIENIDKRGTYIFCANHQSLIDIPLLIGRLPLPVRFLAKRSLFLIPVFGWGLYLAGFIPVDRGIRAKARRSVERGARRIRKGPSLVVFPEGTRCSDGNLLPFRSGAFTMAIQSSVPIVPISIRGTFEVIPKTSLGVVPGRVQVTVGSPIPTSGLMMKDKKALMERVESAVAEMFETGVPV